MQSKITIDIDLEGQPQIRIDYSTKDSESGEDVRDKLVGRMINHLWSGGHAREIVLEKGHEHSSGMVAFIRLKGENHIPSGELSEAGKIQQEVLKKADNWAVLNMPHELYLKWHTEMFGFPPMK